MHSASHLPLKTFWHVNQFSCSERWIRKWKRRSQVIMDQEPNSLLLGSCLLLILLKQREHWMYWFQYSVCSHIDIFAHTHIYICVLFFIYKLPYILLNYCSNLSRTILIQIMKMLFWYHHHHPGFWVEGIPRKPSIDFHDFVLSSMT